MATLVMLCSRLVTVMTTMNVTTALTLCGYAIETPSSGFGPSPQRKVRASEREKLKT